VCAYPGRETERYDEDTTMKNGKLDEKLSRMSDIVDNITSNSLLPRMLFTPIARPQNFYPADISLE